MENERVMYIDRLNAKFKTWTDGIKTRQDNFENEVDGYFFD